MNKKPPILAMDLEGVLIPEVWIAFAEKTGIEKLKLTTRDINDYDELMTMRLGILKTAGLKLKDVQEVIDTLDPLPGAKAFVDWARSNTQFIILSDTFYQFAKPLMAKLNYPTLFCNSLVIDDENYIDNYILREADGKRKSILAFKQIGFYTVAVGDSYNDTTMLKEADVGILFHAPEKICAEFPEFPPFNEYNYLRDYIAKAIGLET